MGKVYQSLKEVVKLQRSKNDPVALAGVKHTHAATLDEEINELEQKISGLKAAVKHHEEVIRNDTKQVIQTLSEDFAMLQTKLKDAEETVHTKESATQKMEETLTAEIHALQIELNTAKETLNNRDNEIKDLKSNVDVLMKQLTESENAIKQAQAEIRKRGRLYGRAKTACCPGLLQELDFCQALKLNPLYVRNACISSNRKK